ncbi:MAG: beta-L-arabinofuranosidase domain-containing protein, partial [Blastocatellia bacterium]
MIRTIFIFGLLLGTLAWRVEAQQKPAETWPGRMPNEARAKLRPLYDDFLKAMRAGDDVKLRTTRAAIVKAMGQYIGVSEDAPTYAPPIDPSPPDLKKVEALWRASFQRMQGRHGWEVAAAAKAQGRPQPRLRISFRAARAYLQSYEAGLSGKDEYLKFARSGFDYIASQQASNGAFGYPYAPNAKEGLVGDAARVVKEGEARGLKMTEGDWVIEDLENGGLQFDNGEAGLGLLHFYALTGESKYLQAARRAGDWAAGRVLVSNFNYNGFSGELLARLYRVTGEKKYLEQAITKMKYGVLPGQMENGRWFDQHNAAIQYHSIMMAQLMELYLALQQAKHPFAAELKSHLTRGLDNLATEINTLGVARGKAHELLCLDALVRG